MGLWETAGLPKCLDDIWSPGFFACFAKVWKSLNAAVDKFLVNSPSHLTWKGVRHETIDICSRDSVYFYL